ncbi:MAG: hypothetical protein AAGE96_24780 [Cyanobacteria bacterium P01_G01_bin.19]
MKISNGFYKNLSSATLPSLEILSAENLNGANGDDTLRGDFLLLH